MLRLANFRAWLSQKPRRVYIAFLLLAVLPTALFFYSVSVLLEKQAETRASEEGTQAARLGAILIKDHFEQSVVILKAFAHRHRLRQALVDGDLDEMTRHLQTAYETSSSFLFFSLYDPRGTLLANYPSMPQGRGMNFAYRDWYKGASRNWKPYVSEVYQTGVTGHPLVVAVAVPIEDKQGKVLGILMAPHRLDTIGDWLKQIQGGGAWTLLVIDKNGRLLAHPGIDVFRPAMDLGSYEPVRRVVSGQAGSGFYRRNGEEWLVAYDPVPGFPWGVLAEVRSSVVRGGILPVQRQVAVLGLVLAGLALGCAALLISIYRKLGRARSKLEILNGELEEKVRDRTAALTAQIAQRERAEEALRDERRFLQAVLDSLGEGIVTCNSDGVATLFNRATREFLGSPEDQILPEQWAEGCNLYQPDGKTLMTKEEAPLLRAWRGEAVRDQEMIIVPKGGRPRALLATGKAIVDDAGRTLGAVVAMHDITERKKLEEQLRQTQKLEAIGTLAGGVAHDFNNILTTILGYASILSSKPGVDSPLREGLEEIRKAGERAASLTQQLLAFSRKQVVAPKITDLNVLVTGMDKMLRRLIGEDIDLVGFVDPELGRIKADPGQIEQVIMNLVVNARDAMPQGGKITIETKSVTLDETYAREHLGVAPGVYVMLAVSDTGIGMDAEVRSHIFEPFFTTKERGKGTGFGLATVYGILKQCGGRIWVYSEPGRGTTFKIYFPRAEGTEVRQIAREGAIEGGHETILLVEDEESVRRLARTTLEAWGYTVIDAPSGDEALRIAGAHEGKIDLMVSDGVMPGIGVRELVASMRSLRPEAKVLLMSGYTDEAIVRHGILEAGTAFIQKPFTPNSLSLKVREVLDGVKKRPGQGSENSKKNSNSLKSKNQQSGS